MWHERQSPPPSPERQTSKVTPKWFQVFTIATALGIVGYFVMLFLQSRMYEEARLELLRSHAIPLREFSTVSPGTGNFFDAVKQLEKCVRGEAPPQQPIRDVEEEKEEDFQP